MRIMFSLIPSDANDPQGLMRRLAPNKQINGPRLEKTCLRRFSNNKGADQPALRRSLISAFVIHFVESIICKFA